MTKINKIVMHGFKSFGERTELLFGDDFNCVMGPNGSGKSNILDSICFVLGKSGSKSLRAEKSANLLYNGGKSKQPAKKGEVSIFFDNKERKFPADQDEIKVTRTVKADGSSDYRINDEKRTRQQVLDLLALARINPDGYNIILQGDIVRLVEMSPVERRQIIEEIAGISVYEEKRQQALRELERVQGRLGESEIILKERQKNLKDLSKDRDQALKYKGLNDKIRQNKASFIKIQMEKKEVEKQGYDEKVSAHTEDFNKHKTKITTWRQGVTERKDEVKKITQEVEVNTQSGQSGLQKQIEDLRVGVESDKTRISSCHNELARIEQRKVQLSQNLDEIKDKMRTLEQKDLELKESIRVSEKQKTELEDKISVFKKKHQLGEESEKVERRIQDIDKDLETRELQAGELREKQQILFREKDKLEFQLQTIDERISKVKEVEEEHQSEIKALKQKKEEFKKATVELNRLLNDDSSLAGRMSSLRTALHEDREKLSKMEVKNISIQERLSGNIAVQKVLDSRRKLGGVHGTVSELGRVKSQFSAALEVAAGNRMDGIVVEDDATAAKCIEFLKQNKYGRATFFPLNKIRPIPIEKNVKDLSKKPGVKGLAIELISYDPKFSNVFSHVFGDTLVVDTIDVSRKIGIGSARMVSLDGDLAEHSGAMVGGFRVKTKGGFIDEDLSDDIQKLQRAVDKAEAELSDLQSRRADHEQKIESLRTLKANLEGEIIKTEKSLHLDTDDLEASKDYKSQIKEQLTKATKDLEEIQETISIHNNDLAKLKSEKQQLRDKINTLKNPTLIAELNAYEQKRNELTEQLIHLKADHKNVSVQKDDILGRDEENASRIVKDMDKETKQFKDEIVVLERQIKQRSKDLKEKEGEQAKLYASFKKGYERRNKLNDELTEFESKIYKEEEQSRMVEYKINALSLELAKVKAELAALEAEFDQYKGVELDLSRPEEDLKKEIAEFEKMRTNIGNVNLKALEIYDTVEKEFNSLQEKKTALEGEHQSVVSMMQEIEGKKKEIFMENFKIINENFKRTFTALSAKGSEAELLLENAEDPFLEGMLIKVRLAGETFLDIRSLSGGEKTMTALSFLFAIQDHEPAHFYVLDEVDAALDKSNADKLAKLIRNYTQNAQYIVISHNDQVISEADTLYGVSMNEHGISKVVSLKF